MKKHMPYRLATGLIAAVLLAGCSSGSGNTASPSAVTQNAGTGTNSTVVQPGTDKQRPDGLNKSGMNIGKIKSISGSTITLYTAQMPEGRPQASGEDGQGTPPGGQGTPPEGGKDGQQADGQQGTPPEGGAQSGEAGQQDGGRPGGMGGMMQNFSEETTDITVTASTEYVSVTYENGQQKETVLTLTDLKADDVIQYTLQTDSATAVKITIGSGGFGFGGGGRGGAPGSRNGQSGTDSTAEAGSAGK